jgi:hypothetical protein
MATMSRVGTGVLLLGGLSLGALMVYTLIGLGGVGDSTGRTDGVADIAVFFYDRVDWLDFRQGIAACAHKGLVRPIHEAETEVVVQTPRRQRPIRFTWHPVRGVGQTRAEVRRLVARRDPALAVVGSDNTYWTTVLAEELRASTGPDPEQGPVLLVPWATALRVEPTDGRGDAVPLLGIYPGRTFRFCMNSRRQADLVIRCMVRHDPDRPPAKVLMVVDQTDPYSVDMADNFRDAAAEVVPKAEVVEADGDLAFPDLYDVRAARWAEDVWRAVREVPNGRPTWLVLPLQGDPARRLIQALRTQARSVPEAEAARLDVVCGDGIGLETLSELAGTQPFAVWAVSSATIHGPGAEIGPDAQVLAELVATIADRIDRAAEVVGFDLRAALTRLDVLSDDPAAVAGRSLEFDRKGERVGDDLGHVLLSGPRETEILAFERGNGGTWPDPLAMPPASLEARLR